MNFENRLTFDEVTITDLRGPVFTALHGMQTRSSDENSVCPSVRPSVRPFLCHTREL